MSESIRYLDHNYSSKLCDVDVISLLQKAVRKLVHCPAHGRPWIGRFVAVCRYY